MITVSVMVLFIGLIFLIIGGINRYWKLAIGGFLMLIGGSLCGIFGARIYNYTKNVPWLAYIIRRVFRYGFSYVPHLKDSAWVFFGEIFAIAGLVFVILWYISTFKIERNRIRQKSEDNIIDFYNECLSNGIYECRSEKEIEKAKLIAQKRKLKFNDISVLYNEAKRKAETSLYATAAPEIPSKG